MVNKFNEPGMLIQDLGSGLHFKWVLKATLVEKEQGIVL